MTHVSKSEAVETLVGQVRMVGLPKPDLEYRFHGQRMWRFDLAWPGEMVACEVDGGTWVGGRHTTGSGAEKDAEKYSEAACLGWRILRVVPHQIISGQALRWVERALT